MCLGSWPAMILGAWDRQCAICGFYGQLGAASVGFDAAHVRWFNFGGPDAADNGLALCTLHHKLFDRGALGVDLRLHIIVSSAYSSRTEAGRAVYDLHGRPLTSRPSTPCQLSPISAGRARWRPDEASMRVALYWWAFNVSARRPGGTPETARALTWVESHCLTLDQMNDPAVMRRALDRLALRIAGQPAAASTVGRKRAVFHNALEYAVELGHLPANPLGQVRWKAPRLAEAVDRRVVVNPTQTSALLAAVATLPRAGHPACPRASAAGSPPP